MVERKKRGEKDGMQISTADMVEDARQRKRLERIQREQNLQEARLMKESDIQAEMDERLQLEELVKLEEEDNKPEEEEEEEKEEEEGGDTKTPDSALSQRNLVDLTNLAQTSMRFNLSVRGSAASCTAYLADLIQAGEISPSKSYLAVDKRKLQRARDKVLADATQRGDQQTDEETIRAILFDSRLDETKVNRFDQETGKYYPGTETQDHYTLTDGAGRFLVHFTKPSKVDPLDEDGSQVGEGEEEEEEEVFETSEDRERRERLEKIVNEHPKPAAVVAKIIYKWMVMHGIDHTLQFLGGDSTNSNTGWRGGIITWVERFLGRKVNWLICQLHTNELGLRHLFEELDGKTSSKTGWSGDLGKLLKTTSNMGINYEFEPISLGPDIIDLPDEVVDDLSTDQNLLYRRAQAVRSGNLSRDLGLRKGGSLVHSRWLTFASEILILWMSNHGLSGELLQRLRTVVVYIVSVYVPMWFRIKVLHSWLDGPRHVLTHLELLRLQTPDVQRILIPYLRTSSWFAHSESILQTLLTSSDAEERKFGVQKILKIRGRNSHGKTAPRKRKLPTMNIGAGNLVELIDWNRAHEPLLTCHLSKEEVKEFVHTPMTVPYYPGHAQAIERAVKAVTIASASVCGEERRDGHVRSNCYSREIFGPVESKQDLASLLLNR